MLQCNEMRLVRFDKKLFHWYLNLWSCIGLWVRNFFTPTFRWKVSAWASSDLSWNLSIVLIWIGTKLYLYQIVYLLALLYYNVKWNILYRIVTSLPIYVHHIICWLFLILFLHRSNYNYILFLNLERLKFETQAMLFYNECKSD